MDTPVEPPNRDGYDALAPRVARVEGDVRDIKDVLGELKVLMVRIDARIEAQLPHLATKAEIAALEARMERRFGDVDRQFGEVSARFGEINARFGEVNAKFGEVNAKFGEVTGQFGEVTGQFGGLEAKLAAMPSKIYMWGILGVLLTAYACGLAALAILK